MTQAEIIEYNKLCAEFRGYSEPVTDKDFYFVEHKDYSENSVIPRLLELNFEKRFHSDWNWIMEVVEAIEKKGYEIDIFSNCVEICDIPDENYITEEVGKTKKEAVVQAIYQFLK